MSVFWKDFSDIIKSNIKWFEKSINVTILHMSLSRCCYLTVWIFWNVNFSGGFNDPIFAWVVRERTRELTNAFFCDGFSVSSCLEQKCIKYWQYHNISKGGDTELLIFYYIGLFYFISDMTYIVGTSWDVVLQIIIKAFLNDCI